MNNQAAKLVKTTAQLSLKFIQLRISGLVGGESDEQRSAGELSTRFRCENGI
jgi:hypothetical protein